MAKSAAAPDAVKPFSLTDKVSFWLLLAGALIVLGGIAISIAGSEYRPPWTSAWFITGVVLCGLGFLSVLWAVALYFARKVAEMRWRPDACANVIGPEESAVMEGSPSRVPGIGIDAAAGGPTERGARLRSVLRETRADLLQAAEAISKAQADDSYATVEYEFDVTERWWVNLQELAGMANEAPYTSVRNAYTHIARIRRIIWGSSTRLGATRPQPTHDLDKALKTIREAEAVLTEELGF
jgi:hypothetical protein